MVQGEKKKRGKWETVAEDQSQDRALAGYESQELCISGESAHAQTFQGKCVPKPSNCCMPVFHHHHMHEQHKKITQNPYRVSLWLSIKTVYMYKLLTAIRNGLLTNSKTFFPVLTNCLDHIHSFLSLAVQWRLTSDGKLSQDMATRPFTSGLIVWWYC